MVEKKTLNKTFISLLISYWIYSLIDVICYLHDCNIIHRDIEPSNIFISYNQSIKLDDFGLSRHIGETNTSNLFLAYFGFFYETKVHILIGLD